MESLTPTFIKQNPNLIVIYNGNLLRHYNRGLATKIHMLPNCYPISTMRSHCGDPILEYWSDIIFDFARGEIERDLARIPRGMREYWITPDIGRAESKLHEKAPLTYEYLMKRLKEEFDFESTQNHNIT